MSVMIGQASIDERGQVRGGQAGDQGNELNIRSWYSNGWTLLLRAKNEAVAEKMAEICEKIIRSKKAGYDQSSRNTLRNCLKAAGWNVAAMTTPCETDCSALMAVCAEAAGVDMTKAYQAGNAPATFQMRKQWALTGAFDALDDRKYLTGTGYLLRGDVLVNEARHTAMVLSDGIYAGGERELIEKSKMIVDGKEVPVERILKNGTNYVKIRDVAAALDLKVGYKGSIATLDRK